MRDKKELKALIKSLLEPGRKMDSLSRFLTNTNIFGLLGEADPVITERYSMREIYPILVELGFEQEVKIIGGKTQRGYWARPQMDISKHMLRLVSLLDEMVRVEPMTTFTSNLGMVYTLHMDGYDSQVQALFKEHFPQYYHQNADGYGLHDQK